MAPRRGLRLGRAGLVLLLLVGLRLPGPLTSFVGSPVAHRRQAVATQLQWRPPSASSALPAWGRDAALALSASRVSSDQAFLRRARAPQALPNPFAWPGEAEETGEKPRVGPRDFFLFIKDYGWSLRYRVGLTSVEEDAERRLDEKEPLTLQWVKLKRPIKNPAELLQADSWELFDWKVMEPVRHSGFMYDVTRWIETGVEAVINFFKGRDLKLLVKPDDGIQLVLGKELAGKGGAAGKDPQSVTHCWVETMGLPFLPILQSVAFFNLQQVVVDWHA
mmetsp:Transcript_12218/g.31398  ORF Transcript_12218/g.31398 Transcript_12218/m.31398 type:complete len:277 (-) Transcript_12218:430-1260(-)